MLEVKAWAIWLKAWAVWLIETASMTFSIYVFGLHMTVCAAAWAFQWRTAIYVLDRICLVHEMYHTRASFDRFAK